LNAAGRGCLYPGCDKFWAGVLGFKTTPKTATKRLTRTHTHTQAHALFLPQAGHGERVAAIRRRRAAGAAAIRVFTVGVVLTFSR